MKHLTDIIDAAKREILPVLALVSLGTNTLFLEGTTIESTPVGSRPCRT